MRISGLQNYMGGADNASAFSLIQGEQRIFTGTWLDAENSPVDISTGYELSCNVEFYTIENLIVTSNKSTLSGAMTLLDNPALKALDVQITDGPAGKFTITFPEALYVDDETLEPIDIQLNIEQDVPIAISYIKYADRSAAPDDVIRVSRLVTIIRRGE